MLKDPADLVMMKAATDEAYLATQLREHWPACLTVSETFCLHVEHGR